MRLSLWLPQLLWKMAPRRNKNNKNKTTDHHLLLYNLIRLSITISKQNTRSSLYIYNRPLGSQSVLIIFWWCSNPEAWSRGVLGSVPKVMLDTLSSRKFNTSWSCLSPPLPQSFLPPEPPSSSLPHPPHPVPTTAWVYFSPVSAPPARHKLIMVLVKMNFATVFWLWYT